MARPEPDAEEEEEEEHPRLPARPKAAELMKLAREAAKDADRRKDADVKRVLRQAGVTACPAVPALSRTRQAPG